MSFTVVYFALCVAVPLVTVLACELGRRFMQH
jgi:hypothetical protein